MPASGRERRETLRRWNEDDEEFVVRLLPIVCCWPPISPPCDDSIMLGLAPWTGDGDSDDKCGEPCGV